MRRLSSGSVAFGLAFVINTKKRPSLQLLLRGQSLAVLYRDETMLILEKII